MGRLPRRLEPDAIYHLTQHGLDDRPIFRDAVDFQEFTLRLARVLARSDVTIRAACLMDTHYHLLASSSTGALDLLMRDLNSAYARAFNRRHGRRGAVFESRYRDRRIHGDAHLGNAVEYIEHNPVAAGVVEDVADWPWTTGWDSPLARHLRPWRDERKGV